MGWLVSFPGFVENLVAFERCFVIGGVQSVHGVMLIRLINSLLRQGLDKKQTVEKHGKDQVMIWRRSYTTPPPLLPDDR